MSTMGNKPQKEREDKPVPIRLNDLKGPLQMWAQELDRSMHYVIIKQLQEAIIKKYNYPANHFDKKMRAGRATR